MHGLHPTVPFTIHTTFVLNVFKFDLHAKLSFQIRLAKQPKLKYIATFN